METTRHKPDAIRQIVRDNYCKIASAFGTCCGAGDTTPCCSGAAVPARQLVQTLTGRIGGIHASK